MIQTHQIPVHHHKMRPSFLCEMLNCQIQLWHQESNNAWQASNTDGYFAVTGPNWIEEKMYKTDSEKWPFPEPATTLMALGIQWPTATIRPGGGPLSPISTDICGTGMRYSSILSAQAWWGWLPTEKTMHSEGCRRQPSILNASPTTTLTNSPFL